MTLVTDVSVSITTAKTLIIRNWIALDMTLVIVPKLFSNTWWRHQMETFSALLALCAGYSPVTGEFPSQRPVTQSFDVFIDLSWKNGWINSGEAGDLRRHCAHYDVTVMHNSLVNQQLILTNAFESLKNTINRYHGMVGVAVAIVISTMHEKLCIDMHNAQKFGKFLKSSHSHISKSQWRNYYRHEFLK